jgi:biotin carboxyl carrier protein
VRFEIEADGRMHLVTIEATGAVTAAGGAFRVTVRAAPDAAPAVVMVDARQTDLGLSLHEPASGRLVDVAVTEGAAGAALVQLPHVDVPVVVDGRRYRRRQDDLAESGEQRLIAPMPGRVLKVFVAVGDQVGPGQSLVVIEAMKMENELRAVQAGRVVEVHVADMTPVEAGRLLVVVAAGTPDGAVDRE